MSVSRLIATLLAIAGTLSMTAVAHAVTYIPASNLGDATVRADSPNTNFGDRPTVVANTSEGVPSSLAYVTFGFSPSAVPTGTPYTGGTLTVYAVRGGRVCVYRAIATFDETTLTWESKPPYNSHFEIPSNVGHPSIVCVTLVKGVNTIDVGYNTRIHTHSDTNIFTYAIESQGGKSVISSSEGRYPPSAVYEVG